MPQDPAKIQQLLIKHFQHQPTRDQGLLIEKLASFISPESTDKIFVIKGYAGTGKTSMVSAIGKTLSRLDKTTVLLAPTQSLYHGAFFQRWLKNCN